MGGLQATALAQEGQEEGHHPLQLRGKAEVLLSEGLLQAPGLQVHRHGRPRQRGRALCQGVRQPDAVQSDVLHLRRHAEASLQNRRRDRALKGGGCPASHFSVRGRSVRSLPVRALPARISKGRERRRFQRSANSDFLFGYRQDTGQQGTRVSVRSAVSHQHGHCHHPVGPDSRGRVRTEALRQRQRRGRSGSSESRGDDPRGIRKPLLPLQATEDLEKSGRSLPTWPTTTETTTCAGSSRTRGARSSPAASPSAPSTTTGAARSKPSGASSTPSPKRR
jgi:hypothetical protein